MYKIFLLILVILISLNINAQNLDYTWAKSTGGSSYENGESTKTDASGNVYVTGYFNSSFITFGTYTLTCAGSNDIYIVKYDRAGNVLWAKSAGGSGDDEGNSITTDASGNIYVTGSFDSPSITFGIYTLANAGLNDMYIVKYDPAGNVLWARRAGGGGGGSDDEGNSVMTDTFGNIYVAGHFGSTSITFGTYTLTSNASGYMFVVKYDSAGNVLWAKSAGGTGGASTEVIGNSITADASGNTYVTGSFRAATMTFGTYTLTNNNAFWEDIFIVKYDPNGNVLWAKCAGGNSADITESIITDAIGNVYVTGYFISASITFGSYTLSNSSQGYSDVFIVKYDPNGNVLWAKSAGGYQHTDNGRGITTDASGNTYITGDFSSYYITFGTTTLLNSTSPGYSDIYIFKFDPAGNVLWAKSAGGSGNDVAVGITTDASGNVYIVGDFQSPSTTFGTHTLTNVGGQDIFVAKLSNVRLRDCSCFGLCNGSATITSTGTVGTYTISLSNGATSSADTAVFSGLCAGSYSYSATNGTDTVTDQFNISQPTVLTAIITPPSSAICQGSCGNLYAMASGGTVPFTYNWSPVIGSGQSINICPGTTSVYSVTVNDAKGCQAFSTSTVIVMPSPTVSVSSGSIVCSGTSASLTATGANTYTWSTGAMTSSITVFPNVTTIYSVTGTNTNNCIGTATTQITINQNPIISLNNGTICEGQSFTITPSGANTYTYSGGSNVVSPHISTSYTITGRDSNNCIETSTIQVVVNPNPTVTIASNSVCIGSSTSITASGANTYTWSTGVNTASINVLPITSTTYSVTGTDLHNCTSTQTVAVTVNPTCQDVWPGDANSDGLVDNTDVLELGLHFTQTGPARSATSNAWQSYFSNNWTGTISNGKNLNHSDCNGDGIINYTDVSAITANYGLMHTFKETEQIATNPQLSIVPDESFINKGAWGSSSVFLGEATAPVTNINGLAFTLTFDQNFIDANNFYIEYPVSFINATDQNLKFYKGDFPNGKLYTATTHTTNTNVSGNGKIAVIHYKIKSTLTTDEVFNIGITQSKQSNAAGTLTPLTAGTATVAIIGASVGIDELSNENNIAVYPNPANVSVTIQSNITLQKIELIGITGQIMLSEKLSGNQHQLNLSEVANGVYFVALYDANQKVTRKKIVVQH